MADTLYERYNTNDDDTNLFFSHYWQAQTFTVGNTGANEDHNITSVKLKMSRTGSPGTITVSIRAVDVNGKPTGADLTSGTTDGDTLTTDAAGEWREITLTSYGLSASTKYAIVVRISGGDISNNISWRIDGSTPTYGGGSYASSNDSGSFWGLDTEKDCMFEEYGPAAAAEGQFMQPTRYW